MQNRLDELLEVLQDYLYYCETYEWEIVLYTIPEFEYLDIHHCIDHISGDTFSPAKLATCLRIYHAAWQNGFDLKPYIDIYYDRIEEIREFNQRYPSNTEEED